MSKYFRPEKPEAGETDKIILALGLTPNPDQPGAFSATGEAALLSYEDHYGLPTDRPYHRVAGRGGFTLFD